MRQDANSLDVLKRNEHPEYDTRPIMFVSLHEKTFIFPDASAERWQENDVTIEEILNWTLPLAGHQEGKRTAITLFIVAGNRRRNQPEKRWFVPPMKSRWKLEEFGNDRTLNAVYTQGLHTVYMWGTGGYFGEARNIWPIRHAFFEAEKSIKRFWGMEKTSYHLQMTASATGRNLLELSLPVGVEYTKLTEKQCLFLADKFGQGRFELFPGCSMMIEKLARIDGRLMYGSCISHLPVGRMVHTHGDGFAHIIGKQGQFVPLYPGFYHGRAYVPKEWGHIGLLPCQQQEGTVTYPRQPGMNFETWCTGDELALAREYGWQVIVDESIIWPDTDSIADPFRTWRKRLVTLFMEEKNSLIRGVYRAITLSTLGSLNQFATIKERHTPRQEFMRLKDVSVAKILKSTSKWIDWLEYLPLPAYRQKFIHPEMAKTLWGKGRAKVARQALMLPFEKIVAITTDEILVADPSQEMLRIIQETDTGKPGSFRHKGTIDGLIWPSTKAELLELLTSENKRKEVWS